MKPHYTLLILSILICCITSCSKKEDAAPAKVATPVTKDSTTTTTAITYPPTDTFSGTYYDTVIQYDAGDWGSFTPMVVQSPFVFYVVYPNASQVVFMNGTAIHWLSNSLYIKDTFTIVPYGSSYQATAPHPFTDINYQINGDYFLLGSAINLTFTWSYYQTLGCVDAAIHSCQFNGTKK